MLSPKDFSGAPKAKEVSPLPETVAEDFSSLVGLVHSRFQRAKIARQQEQELIHLDAYRAWRGVNSPAEQSALDAARQRNHAASGFFIKITKSKATAAYGQICEILFANNKFPIGVEPNTKPEGIEDTVTIVPEGVQYGDQIVDPYGYKGDNRNIPPGSTQNSLISNLKSSFSSLLSKSKLVFGPSPDANQLPEIHPAEIAAVNLERVMQQQLEEGFAEKVLRKAAYECVLYGTGIIKGPFSYNDVRPNWNLEDDNTITYNPESKLIP